MGRAYTGIVSDEVAPPELFSLLDDEYARLILTKTSEQPMSAKALSEAADASKPTIYRRLERLQDAGLVTERKEFREEGRHYSVYEARLEQLSITLSDGDLEVELSITGTEDPADRFTRMWEGVR